MAALVPSCPRQATIPGFPSAQRQEQCMVKILPTCAKAAKVPGLPSRDSVRSRDTDWVVDRRPLWKKPLRKMGSLILQVSPPLHKDKTLLTNMVNMMPSCPRQAILPGFPSAPRQRSAEIPSMVDILPSCPRLSKVPGLPCINQAQAVDWPVNKKPLFKKFLVEKTGMFHFEGTGYHLCETVTNMSNMLPSCPRMATIPGFPSALRQEPSMVYLLPACPKVSRILGLPSRQSVSRKEDVFVDRRSLWQTPLKKCDVLILPISSAHYKETDRMVAMVPSCPCKASMPGFPSAPQKRADSPSMVCLLPTCSKLSQIPGCPSTQPVDFKDDDWSSKKESFWERPLLKSDIKIYTNLCKSYKDNKLMKGMAAMLSSCPSVSSIPGLPSLYGWTFVETPSMLNLLSTCPRHSRISGLPSRLPRETDEGPWHANKKPMLVKQLKKRAKIVIQGSQSFKEKAMVRIMVSMLPPCPKNAKIPGFPSKSRQRPLRICVKEDPCMLNTLPTCPENSRVSGLPSRHPLSIARDGWNVERQSLWKKPLYKGKEFVPRFHPIEMSLRDKEIMLSMVPSCPRQATMSGFPSKVVCFSRVQKEPRMTSLLPTCPEKSDIIGFPSRRSVWSDVRIDDWPQVKSVFWEKPLQKVPSTQLHSQFQGQHCDKDIMNAMVSLTPSCPNVALCPGFPSMSQFGAEKLSSMVNSLPSCPKISSALGLPSANTSPIEGPVKGWPAVNNPLLEKHLKVSALTVPNPPVFNILTPDKHFDTNMMALEPTCPNQARIPGFPSSNKTSPVKSCGSMESIVSETIIDHRGDAPIKLWSSEQMPLSEKSMKEVSPKEVTVEPSQDVPDKVEKKIVGVLEPSRSKSLAPGFSSSQIQICPYSEGITNHDQIKKVVKQKEHGSKHGSVMKGLRVEEIQGVGILEKG